jgi:hypothetical protein
MHIDSYQFGKIVINGTAYKSDCLIINGAVKPNWWRKQGHLLTPEDLEPVIAARPRFLVVGCGASGMMKVSVDVSQLLQEHGIELFKANTNKAVDKFNELAEKGEKVAAALHLTC